MPYPFSARFNALVGGPFATAGVWTPFDGSDSQSCEFSEDGTVATMTIPSTPGAAIDVGVWYFPFSNRSALVPHVVSGAGMGSTTRAVDQTRSPSAEGTSLGTGTISGDANCTSQDGTPQVFLKLGTFTPTGTSWTLAVHGVGAGAAVLDTVFVGSSSPIPPVPKPAIVGAAKVGTAGHLVALFLTDRSGRPSVLSAVDGTKTPVVKVNGTPVATSAPAWGDQSGQPALAHAVLRMTAAVGPSDVVTVDVLDSWCTTAAGACAAASGIAAANLVGGPILPPPPTARRMEVGINVSFPSDMNLTPFADLKRGLADWVDGSGNPPPAGATFDAAGNVTALGSAAFLTCQVVGGFQNPANSAQSYRQCIPGLYTLIYSGTVGHLALSATGATVASGPTTVGGVTTVAYQVPEAAPHFGPNVALVCTGAATLLHIYPPDPAAPTSRSLDGSSKWHPQCLDKLAGFDCIRGMDWLNTNNSNVVNSADFNVSTNLSYSRVGNDVTTAPIARIDPYNDTTGRYDGGLGGVLILFTTGSPHGLALGPIQNGTLSGFVGPGESGPNPPGKFPTVSPTDTVALNGRVTICDALTATTFIGRIRATTTTTAVLAGSYTTGDFGTAAVVKVANRLRCPPGELVDLCNTTGKDLWLNAPLGATDLCLWNPADPANSLFGLAFSTLSPSLAAHVELSNEVWNFNFLQFTTATILANLAGQSLAVWVTHRTARVHALALEAAAALGWGGTIRLVYSALATDLGTAFASGYRVDEVCIAPYASNQPFSDSFESIYATYTQPDFMDLWDFYLIDSDAAATVAATRAALAVRYPNASVVCYEFGVTDGELSSTGPSARSRAWARHPRQFQSTRDGYLPALADNGCTLANYFNLSGPLRNSGFTNWPAYINCDQADGTGDPSENASFDDFTTGVVSEIGGALHAWNELVPPTPGDGGDAATFAGHVALGADLDSAALFLDGSGTPTAPDATPTFRVYGPSGAVPGASGTCPALDPGNVPGLVGYTLDVTEGAGFVAGATYQVVITGRLGGVPTALRQSFAVV